MNLQDHYLNSGVPDEITENLIEFFPNEDGLSYEEVLLQQVILSQDYAIFNFTVSSFNLIYGLI